MSIKRIRPLCLGTLLLLGSSGWAQNVVNVLCSAEEQWCRMAALAFNGKNGDIAKIKRKSSGEALEMLRHNKNNPVFDIWFGGPGDGHLQAAQENLTETYQSPSLPLLHDWAQAQAQRSGYKTVGIYAGPLGISYNSELLEAQKIPPPTSWNDLLNPAFKGQVLMANPATSGTAYMIVATLVQLMGEDKAFAFMRALNSNIARYTRIGSSPIFEVAQGKAMVSIGFVPDVPTQLIDGLPIEGVVPLEGSSMIIGSMSLVKGGRNPQGAKLFYEWQLSQSTQEMATAAKQFYWPSLKSVPRDPLSPDAEKIKTIDYDYAKYGSIEERTRLLEKWEKEFQAGTPMGAITKGKP
jgi:iron(III) transport system substrate-binding protein